MKEDLTALLKVVEYIEEIFPAMGYVSANSTLLPPNIVVVGANYESVANLIRPKCEKLEKECNMSFIVDYEDAIDEIDEDSKGDSAYNPTRSRRHTQYDCCYVFFRDKLRIVEMWLEAQGKPDMLPLSLIIEKLRKDVYPTLMGGNLLCP